MKIYFIYFLLLMNLTSCKFLKKTFSTQKADSASHQELLPGDIAFLFPLPKMAVQHFKYAELTALKQRTSYLMGVGEGCSVSTDERKLSPCFLPNNLLKDLLTRAFEGNRIGEDNKSYKKSEMVQNLIVDNRRFSKHLEHATQQLERWKILGLSLEPMKDKSSWLSFTAQPVFDFSDVVYPQGNVSSQMGTARTPVDFLKAMHTRDWDDQIPRHLINTLALEKTAANILTEDFALHFTYKLDQSETAQILKMLKQISLGRPNDDRKKVWVFEDLSTKWRDTHSEFLTLLASLARGQDLPFAKRNLKSVFAMLTTVDSIAENWSFSHWSISNNGELQNEKNIGSKASVLEYEPVAALRAQGKSHSEIGSELYTISRAGRIAKSLRVYTNDLSREADQFNLVTNNVHIPIAQAIEAADYKFSLIDELSFREPWLEQAKNGFNPTEKIESLFEKVRSLSDPHLSPIGGKGCVSCHSANSYILNYAAHFDGFPTCLIPRSSTINCGSMSKFPKDPKSLELKVRNLPDQEMVGGALLFETPILPAFNFRHLGYYVNYPSVSFIKQIRTVFDIHEINSWP